MTSGKFSKHHENALFDEGGIFAFLLSHLHTELSSIQDLMSISEILPQWGPQN